MKKTYNSVRNKYKTLIIPIILCIVVFLTIGYSAFSTELGINEISAIVRVQKDVRIDGISLSSVTGNATSQYEEYNVKNIFSSISLPNNNSSVTYDVVIHNLGNVEMGILDITDLPSNLKYSISNYNLKEPLCDDEDSSQCKLGTTTTLHLKIEYNENGYDENNTDYIFNLDFDFKRMFSITYTGFSGNTSGLPSKMIDGDTLAITFDNTSGIPSSVTVTGASSSYTSPTLSLTNVTDNITITATNTGSGGQGTPVEDDTTTTYDPDNIPPNSNIVYTAVDGAPQVATDENGNITSFEFTEASSEDPVTVTSDKAIETGFVPFDGSSNWELDMKFSYDSEANSSTSNSKTVSVLGASDWSTGTLTSGFTFRFYNFKNVSGTSSTYRFNGILKYRPQLQVENNGDIDSLQGLFITGSSGVFMTSPMVYTIHIIKNGNNMIFELSNGSELNYHPTKNSNTGYSTANANTKKTVTWQDNGSSSNVDITIGGYLSSSGTISQQANIDVYNFSVRKTN